MSESRRFHCFLRDVQSLCRFHLLAIVAGLLMLLPALGTTQAPSEQQLSEYPPEVQARLRAADEAYRNKQWQQSRTAFKEVTLEYPELAYAHVGLGLSIARLGNYPSAIETFHRALELLPDSPKLQGELADAYRKNKQFDEAEEWYNRAIEAAKENADVSWYIGLGLIETARKNLERARQHYISAILHDPNATMVYHNLGTILLQQRRLDEADAAFQMVLEQNDRMYLALFGRGQVALKRGKLSTAERFFLDVIQRQPDLPDCYIYLVRVREQLGDLAGAEEILDKALSRASGWAPGYIRRGQIRQKQHNAVGAETDFREAIRLRPDVAVPQAALAQFLAEEERELEEALTLARSAVEKDPRPEHRAIFALALYRLGQSETALSEIDRAYGEAPNHPTVLGYRAQILGEPEQ